MLSVDASKQALPLEGSVLSHPRAAIRCARTSNSSGFTILELMLILGIMGILTAIAVSKYQDYTKRTRMLEVMVAAGSCRNQVFEAYYYGRAPGLGEWGCERGNYGTYVESIELDENGKVIVTARGFGDDDIDGKVLTLTPLVEGVPAQVVVDKAQQIGWRCGSSADGTTISVNFLPSSCREVP